MKHVGWCWDENSSKVLNRFKFVFYIALKNIKVNQSIEDIIPEHHGALSGNNVQPHEIKEIVEEFAEQNILILLDGYDEYKFGY